MSNLAWGVYENPVYSSASALVYDLAHVDLTASNFATIAQGGFAEGELSFASVSERFIQNVLDNWLTKRVIGTDGGGVVAYEGYIAEIHAILNHHAFVRSIDDFANRVFIESKCTGGSCPKGKACKCRTQRNESNVATTTTQTQYGIKEEWLDITGQGVVSTTRATAEADVRLKELLRGIGFDFALGADDPRENQLSLVLWGYNTTLQWRKQSTYAKTATDIGTIVSNALSVGSKAPFLSSDRGSIATVGNTIKFNVEKKPIWLQDFIQAAIVGGDSNAKQLFFQVWEERKPMLYARPAAPGYFSRYDDPRIWDAYGHVVPPYLVRAGTYIAAESLNEAADPLADSQQRGRVSLVTRTQYDDLTGKLEIPTPNTLMTQDRLDARARRVARRFIV